MATITFAFRLSPQEKERLERIAAGEGTTISALIRRGLSLLNTERRMISAIAQKQLERGKTYPLDPNER
ncbi:ribbon-helix-helix protein, CopG family [Leptolyngbya sp. GGD]|uniref:ribbon-helix-helix protein, CopG family n=1 Tax=Leptolyngbya sp. GGD TaxID=2997907 RepID=UPI00227AE51F|nr:ribbon-helix-helix protein, CopG family [Leptolyngbya sp. GGD]MCY6493156.1 ribbon-helix-helix protein, CopG family [Leptolyngbya sp. GGD]